MKNYSAKTIGVGFGFLGFFVIGGLQVATILRSTLSTASIGFIFLPIPCLLAFAAFFIFGYCIGYIRDDQVNQNAKGRFRKIASFVFVIFFLGFIIKETTFGLLATKYVSEIENTTNLETIISIFDHPIIGKNKFVLGAIAQNESASPALLDKIAHLEDSDLYEAMGSLFPALGKNGKGLAVMRLIALNKNVLPSTLDYLASNAENKYVLGDVAGNSKTSESTLRRLEKENNYLIDWGLARNRNTPQDIFIKLLERNMDYSQQTTLGILAENPSTSTDVKEKASTLLKTFK